MPIPPHPPPPPPGQPPGIWHELSPRWAGIWHLFRSRYPGHLAPWKKHCNTLCIPIICINSNRDSSVKGCFQFYFVTTWVLTVKYRKQKQILKILDAMNRRSQFYNVLKYQWQGTTPRLTTWATTSSILPGCVVQLQTNVARRSKILIFLRTKLGTFYEWFASLPIVEAWW